MINKPHVEMGIESDVAYIKFTGDLVSRTVHLIPDRLLIDLDDSGRLIGIEILGVGVPFRATA